MERYPDYPEATLPEAEVQLGMVFPNCSWGSCSSLEVFYVEGHGRAGTPSISPHIPLATGNFISAGVASDVIIRSDGQSCDHVT